MTFGAESTTTEVLHGIDLNGKVAVVTGASTGLGLETARALAAAGAHVVLCVRSDDKAETATATIRESVPGASLDHVAIDLTSLTSVRAAATTLRDRYRRIDLLINNAGVMFTPFERTSDGFELQFGTNHVGHFVFTNVLVPSVVAAAPSRIVNLSSGGHGISDIIWDDPNYESRPYDKFEAYGQSKTANILFSVELERRLAGKGVHAYAVHPGMIVTELGRYMTREDRKELGERIARGASSGGAAPSYKSIPQGAATTVWAATAAALGDHGGVYLADCGLATPAERALDPDRAARLWSLSEQLVGETFAG